LKLLVDTHVLLWWLGNDGLLSETATALIKDPGNVVFVSAVTLWEIWLKQSLGKLRLPAEFERKLAKFQAFADRGQFGTRSGALRHARAMPVQGSPSCCQDQQKPWTCALRIRLALEW
jgi:PIN domain nuclease of toxin-antitoxin system